MNWKQVRCMGCMKIEWSVLETRKVPQAPGHKRRRMLCTCGERFTSYADEHGVVVDPLRRDGTSRPSSGAHRLFDIWKPLKD